MKNMCSFFGRLCPFPIPRRAAMLVALTILAWSSLAFCGGDSMKPELLDAGSNPTLRYPVACFSGWSVKSTSYGWFDVTRKGIRYGVIQPATKVSEGFEIANAEIKNLMYQQHYLLFERSGEKKKYMFFYLPQDRWGTIHTALGAGSAADAGGAGTESIFEAIRNFDNVLALLTAAPISTNPHEVNIDLLARQCKSLDGTDACRELAKIAEDSKDASVRGAAVANLTDQSWLARIAEDAKDARVRGAAVANLTDQSLLASIAVKDNDASVRRAAIAKLIDQSLLAKIAAKDEDASVRSAAADRQAAFMAKTEASKLEASRVLSGFLSRTYYVPSDPKELVNTFARIYHHHRNKVPHVKGFVSIDEMGYTFTSTPVILDGYSTTLHEVTWIFHLGPGVPVHVRFADVTRVWIVSRTYVRLLNDAGSILDDFSATGPELEHEVLPALKVLCPNLK